MTNKELAAALRLCGSEKPIDNCPKCPFFEGYAPDVCIPKMTAACADALGNSETHVMALQQEIEKLRGQLEVERRPQWVSMSERLPDVGKDVLTSGTAGGVRVMHLNKGGRDWSIEVSRWHGFLIPRNSVTHWMPLTEPPKEAKEDGKVH